MAKWLLTGLANKFELCAGRRLDDAIPRGPGLEELAFGCIA